MRVSIIIKVYHCINLFNSYYTHQFTTEEEYKRIVKYHQPYQSEIKSKFFIGRLSMNCSIDKKLSSIIVKRNVLYVEHKKI